MLEATLVDPAAAQLLRSGRLNAGLQHVGFGVVDETGRPTAGVAPLSRSRALPHSPLLQILVAVVPDVV